jgi:hypothetical protein
MAHYRIQRTLPNGWNIRLEFISWDGVFSTTPTDLGEVVLTELGTLSAEFDSLPYGLMNPMTFDFKLIWDNLPAPLQTFLEQGYGTYGGYECRNTWYLFSDRGTSGATWSLEFAGCEDNVEALELEPLENGMFSYSVELVDIAYFWMKTRTGKDMFTSLFITPSSPQSTCWQVYFSSSGLASRRQEFEFFSINASGRFYKLEDVCNAYYSTSPSFVALSHTYGSQFDYTQTLKSLMTHAVTFYRQDSYTALPRTATSIVPNNYLYVIGKIESGSNVIGGVLSPNDQFGLANPNTSSYDVLRQLAEQSFVRIGYRFERTGTGSGTQIRVIFDVKQITQARDYDRTVATPDQTLSLDSSLSYSKVTVRGENILKAETRYETTSDKDATQIVKIQKGARASRSFNFEPLLINMPVDVQDNNDQNTWPRFKAPLKQTNQIYFNIGDSGMGSPNQAFVKVHEKTQVQWGTLVTDKVVVDPDGLKNPVSATDFKTNPTTQTTYYLQINDCQVSGGISGAVTSALITVFANEKNAILEADWIVSQNTKVLPDYICGKYALTGTITTRFTGLNWTRAMPTSIEWDLMADTVKHKYMLVK